MIRLALANLSFPSSPEDSIRLAVEAIAEAASHNASIICFPECFVPGYRAPNKAIPPPDPVWLEHAWSVIAAAAAKANLTVILGTERVVDQKVLATALVIEADGSFAGFQDKVQLDPSEDTIYAAGNGRRVFTAGPHTFGIVICHEGYRYPETVRSAARKGAQIVFHLQFSEAEDGSFQPTSYADPKNSFHEKAVLCRAAENNCYFAAVNYASPGSPTTSALVNPDGLLLSVMPYGKPGLLITDIDPTQATNLLASRFKPELC
ncbi:MAG: carbon-nitrogen hydrolase family protein [Acidobacteria bacterium]|nr:carbon-nitrogen hydrolase family protein [Acidobacteriota bacterium]